MFLESGESLEGRDNNILFACQQNVTALKKWLEKGVDIHPYERRDVFSSDRVRKKKDDTVGVSFAAFEDVQPAAKENNDAIITSWLPTKLLRS